MVGVIYPAVLNRTDCTHSTSQTFLELQEIAIPVPLLTHLENMTHRQLNPAYTAESLSTYHSGWGPPTVQRELLLQGALELVQKGKKFRRDTLGSKRALCDHLLTLRKTSVIRSGTRTEAVVWWSELSSSSFPCSEWQGLIYPFWGLSFFICKVKWV